MNASELLLLGGCILTFSFTSENKPDVGFCSLTLKIQDLRPGDVSGKRNLWEKQSVEKPAASSKVITLLGSV